MSGRGRAGPEVGHVDGAVGPDREAGRLEETGYRQRRDGVAVAADPDQGAGGGGRRQQPAGAVLGGQEAAMPVKGNGGDGGEPACQILAWWPGTTR